MQKFFKIMLATIITIFTIPFGGITALADSDKVYDDIKDGEYKIKIELLTKGTDDTSIANQYVNEDAKLNIENGKAELVIAIPKLDGFKFEEFEIEGVKFEKTETEEIDYYKFKINEVKSKLASVITYTLTEPFEFYHPNVGMDIELVGLDDLPKIEEDSENPEEEKPDPEVAEEERVVDNILTEDEADSVELYEFDTDSQATAGQFKNPVKLLEKDDKQYVQILINEGGAQFFRSLKFNGEEVIWNSITEGPYVIQYELPNGIDAEIDVSMVIQAGPNAMPHDNIKLWFNEISEEPEQPTEKEIELGVESSVESNTVVRVKGSQGTQITMPGNLPNDVELTVTSKEIENSGDLEVAGDVLNFNFENINFDNGDYEFELVMGYDTDKYNDDQVDIYYYDSDNKEWIAQDGTVKDGKVTVAVNHFSTYGVFAEEKKESEKPTDPENEDQVVLPESAEEIDYVILHENGKDESTANNFFVKPGHLFEKDGKTYVQVTVNNGDMIKDLSTKFGKAVIVNENKDGSIDVQFQINNDRSDTTLEMRIVVPGMYDTEHSAIFSINEEDPVKPTAPKEDPKPEPKPKPKETSTTQPEKVYAIDYIVKHETEDQASAADGFFVKPGHILKKDGQKYLQVTITNWDFINSLKYDGKDVIVAKVNDDGSALVQFKLDGELSDVIKLNFKLTVPGVYENQEHSARLVLNPESIEEVDETNFILYDSPSKPTLGENGDNDEKPSEKTMDNDKPKNPKTGDTSKVLLYTMLLFGSLIPLGVQLRRRFIKA